MAINCSQKDSLKVTICRVVCVCVPHICVCEDTCMCVCVCVLLVRIYEDLGPGPGFI